MRLDKLALEVEPDQAAVAPNIHLLAQICMWNRVQRFAEADVMVLVHFARRPARGVEARPLLVVAMQPFRPLRRRPAVVSGWFCAYGSLHAPNDRLSLRVRQIQPLLATEEVAAHVRYGLLDMRLVLCVACERRIDHKTAIAGVFLQPPPSVPSSLWLESDAHVPRTGAENYRKQTPVGDTEAPAPRPASMPAR